MPFTITDGVSEIGGTCEFGYNGFTITLDNRYSSPDVTIYFHNTYLETKHTIEGAINYCNNIMEEGSGMFHAALSLSARVTHLEKHQPTDHECRLQLARNDLRRSFEEGTNNPSKIPVIKRFKEIADCGLREAKIEVEALVDFPEDGGAFLY